MLQFHTSCTIWYYAVSIIHIVLCYCNAAAVHRLLQGSAYWLYWVCGEAKSTAGVDVELPLDGDAMTILLPVDETAA